VGSDLPPLTRLRRKRAHAHAAAKRRDDAGKFQIELRGSMAASAVWTAPHSTLGLCALIQKLIGCELLRFRRAVRATCLSANSKAAAAVSRCAVAVANWFSYGRGDDKEQIALADNLAIVKWISAGSAHLSRNPT